jgi:FAD/FMN-containing dehydrogenase
VTTSPLPALSERLRDIELTASAAIEPAYLRDWVVPMTEGAALALVKPRTTEEVSRVLAACHALDLPVVPQGGRTGLAGGATPIDGAVIVSLERMSGVLEIDPAAATLTAFAGTPLETVQQAARDAGWFFALDLGARGSCQIGGAIATNAGGNRVIRYGMTRDLVLGLEAVLADGTILSSLNKLIKNNAGLDVRQVFVGSEGTLGIITKAVLKLHPQPKSQCTALVALRGYDDVLELLARGRSTLATSLSAFEMMWPDFYRLMATPAAGFAFGLPDAAGAYVLVESCGADVERDQEVFESWLGAAVESGVALDALVAHSPGEAREFWRLRDSSGEFGRLGWPHLGYDIGIPTREIGRFVEACRQALSSRWPGTQTAFFGHIGDSNLHLHLKRPDGGSEHTDVHELVYGLVRTFGGTTSAEHGIGLLKRKYLGYTRSAEEIALMRRIKRALDPKGILNPGKIWGDS